MAGDLRDFDLPLPVGRRAREAEVQRCGVASAVSDIDIH